MSSDRGKRDTRIHTRRIGALPAAVLLLLLLALSACSAFDETARVEVGMVERNGLNSTQARFEIFTGRKRRAEALTKGNTLSLNYEADVAEGTLNLLVVNPSGEVVWERELEAGSTVRDNAELVAGQAGAYTIAVLGDSASGSYQLAWDEQE